MTLDERACPFCAPLEDRVFARSTLSFAIWDAYAVTAGHCLIVPNRHATTWGAVSEEERADLIGLIDLVCAEVDERHRPDGFNIGMNLGAAAGQTVPHLHLHVIPRRHGDVADPRGGIRHVIPGMGNYLQRTARDSVALLAEEPRPTEPLLTTGAEDPLLPLLEADLAAAKQVDIAVAFVLPSGVERMYPHFKDLLDRGGGLRLLTGDYFAVSDPDALERLLDLQALCSPAPCVLRIFECSGQSFHPKAYVLSRGARGGVAYVGSSNLSEAALTDGIEWNYRISSDRDANGWLRIESAFEKLFYAPSTRPLNHGWLERYRARRPAMLAPTPRTPIDQPIEPSPPPPTPHGIQVEALAALSETRRAGYKAGLVVLATGLGKTWLAAFDASAFKARRVLFVAHRQEILGQAMATFRRIFPSASIGVYDGQTKEADAEILFASIQTLGRLRHLQDFSAQAFDYVVVDEFHHASAATYTRLINYFEPRFLLALTATPERSDGGDLMTLCQENLVYRCAIPRGIEEGLLSAYHYFGVPDLVDYANIPWRSTRFDEIALTQAVATQERAANVLDQWQRRGGERTLAFCASQRHAEFMRAYFAERAIPVAAVHSGSSSDPRALTLERLRDGELRVVFAVDMFNEGVDVPAIDTVMMLRPTESTIVWLQQFGRGLRKFGDKTLTVIDYIGNHRSFLLKARTLLAVTAPGDGALSAALQRAHAGDLLLPPGCEVTYELEAVNIMRALLRSDGGDADVLKRYYLDFRDRTERRPTASEAFHDGYLPRSARPIHGSWLGFVGAMGDIDGASWEALASARGFLDGLESTRMTRAYKMLLLVALLNLDGLPGDGVEIETLAEEFLRLASRSPKLLAEIGSIPEDGKTLVSMLERNPIDAWTGEAALGGRPAFRYEARRFWFQPVVPEPVRPLFQELVRELAEWRLAEYLARQPEATTSGGVRLKVSHSGGQPILFLPAAAERQRLPTGWTPVEIEGRAYEANFVKVALNVVREKGLDENALPGLLRKWFGPDAGKPGTNYAVECREDGERWALSPLGAEPAGREAQVLRRYPREQIPELFGVKFSQAIWNAGFVVITPANPQHLILLVTLDKGQMGESHQYGDKFLSPDVFQWQSQNQTTQISKNGRLIQGHAALGISVHLFVRAAKRQAGGAAPFVYCGPVMFETWEGNEPITVSWRLVVALPERMAEEFRVGR